MARDWAAKLGTKVLPKQLVSETPILLALDEENGYVQKRQLIDSLRKVEVIIVEDNKIFADSLIRYIFTENNVDYFINPLELKKVLSNYSKETHIYLDNSYPEGGISGVEFAKELFNLGYTRLYLLSGTNFQSEQLPSYLKVICKDNTNKIKDW